MSSEFTSAFPNPEFLELQEQYQAACRGNQQPCLEDYVCKVPELHRAEARTLLLQLNEELRVRAASLAASEHSLSHPDRIDRFRIVRVIGKGGFAWVYEAEDPVLLVRRALKMPRTDRLQDSSGKAGGTAFIDELERFRAEARNLAKIDHPAVVRVFDVVNHDAMPVIVQEYIDGCDLSQHLKRKYWEQNSPVPVHEAVRLITAICHGLRAAHAKRIYHRDLKPANILLDRNLEPKIADFGLALHNTQLLLHSRRVEGTMSYMAPEQIDGLTAKIDGRTDIWAVGVMLYEMLAGERPFNWPEEGTHQDVYQRARASIHESDPPPLREVRDDLPDELIRICGWCLEKRKDDRYDSVQSLCEELEALQPVTSTRSIRSVPGAVPGSPDEPAADEVAGRSPSTTAASNTLSSSVQAAPVISHGLLAFSREDQDFFLQLLPGTRDRSGLPPAVAFWKNRIEGNGPSQAFSVGLLYGPVGCGKSSLMRAGILPRLSDSVVSVYIECTARDTEERVRRKLRETFPGLPDEELPVLMRFLQQGNGLKRGQKVLLVLDQFEQWLNCHRGSPLETLTFALQHCDGVRLQAILMVRDDFFHPAEDLLGRLDVRAVEGQNKRRLELFDPQHALKVLTLFGQAQDRLPLRISDQTAEQTEFLNETIKQLTSPQNGRVISVHLALFVQMYGGRPWTRATLRQLGGAEGLGLRFLQESFERREYQPYASAAQLVLKQLLPPAGRDLKGTMQPASALMIASGLSARPEKFGKLMEILEDSLRLVTPATSHELTDAAPNETAQTEPYFQLTHDYLVTPLHKWLASKQKETPKGRAELMLEERAAEWQRKRTKRHLLSFREYIQVRRHLQPAAWNSAQKQLMDESARYHRWRLAITLLLLCMVLLLAGQFTATMERTRSREFAQKVAEIELSKLPAYLSSPQVNGQHTLQDLADARAACGDAPAASKARLKLAIAALTFGDTSPDLPPVVAKLATQSPPEDLQSLAELLDMCWSDNLNTLLQQTLSNVDGTVTARQSLHAACLLTSIGRSAGSSSDSRSAADWQWQDAPVFVAQQVARENTAFVGTYRMLLKPAASLLIDPLVALFRDKNQSPVARQIITEILIDYQAENIALLVELLLEADPQTDGILFPMLQQNSEAAIATLRKVRSSGSEDGNEKLAAAAVALLRLDSPENLRQFLKNCETAGVQSRILDRLNLYQLKLDPAKLFKLLQMSVRDNQVSPLLVLGIGHFAQSDQLPKETTELLRGLYETHPDPAIHGACEWSLRKLDQSPAILEITNRSENGFTPNRDRRWYVTSGPVRITLARIDPINQFRMGSPEGEHGRFKEFEVQHTRSIPRSFFIAMHEVTVRQFRVFDAKHGTAESLQKSFAPTDDCPVIEISWYQAAAFCNWLSEQESIPPDQWCYEKNANGEYSEGMQLRENYLQLEGYRLPSEAEWEYACRCGTTTARFFGESDQLLHSYGWYSRNSDEKQTIEVGRLLPNGFGLFDMYGNVFEWCLDRSGKYPEGAEIVDHEQADGLQITGERVLRGGSFEHSSRMARSANRFTRAADSTVFSNGFRIARTLPRTR